MGHPTTPSNSSLSPVSLVFGATTPIGLSLIEALARQGKPVIASGRAQTRPQSIPKEIEWFPFDFLTTPQSALATGAPWASRVVETAYILSHPTFRQGDPDPMSLLPAVASTLALCQAIEPWCTSGSRFLFLLPDSERMPLRGYQSARIYLESIKELIAGLKIELSRRNIGVAAILLAHVPGHNTPHMSPKSVEKVARTTASGRLFGTAETVRLLLELADRRSPEPFPKEPFLTPDGPASPDPLSASI